MLLSVPAPAAIVTTTADSGPGSLRDAISNAAPGETITFSGVGTITLTSGELLIDKDLIISGPGPGSLVIQRSTASGTPDFRIFHASSANVIISGLTVSNGRDDFGGGGIYNDFDLTLNDCDVTGNFAAAGGGMENDGAMAISNCVFWGNSVVYAAGDGLGGGIYNFGTLDAVNCLISSNSVTSGTGNGFGGGIENDGSLTLISCIINGNSATGSPSGGSGFGGGMDNEFGTVYAVTSTVSGNVARGGTGTVGGLAEGAGVANGFGTVELDHSTVRGNTATGGAGGNGGWSEGGGVANDFGTVYVDSSTVSGNVSIGGAGTSGTNGLPYGGGIYNGFGSVMVTYSTIAYNAVPGGFPNDGGGIYNYGGGVELDSTIVAADNASVDLFNDLTGSGFTISDGFNVIGSMVGSFTPGPVDQTGVTATALNLGPLQNNGGPTFTHALLCGSVALNTGDTANAPATDQRGFPRIVGGIVDVGAFESANGAPTIYCPTPVTFYDAPSSGQSGTVSVDVGDSNGDPLLVLWTMDGIPVQTNLVAASGQPTATSVSFTTLFGIGHHSISVWVSDPFSCMVTCSTTVDVQPATLLPHLTLIKTASPTIAAAGQPVTYTYAVTNTGGVTISNINITDDNGTPSFTNDDFNVNDTPFSLTSGQGRAFVLNQISEPMCMLNGGTNLPAGTLTVKVLTNGDVAVSYMQLQSVVDNRYGTNATTATGWPGAGHKFSDLTGNDDAEFKFTDGKGNVVMDFFADYISAATSAKFGDGVTNKYPSGFGTLGELGGDGSLVTGSASNILSVHTTLSDVLNRSPFTNATYQVNSARETTPLSNVSVPAGWNYTNGYSVVVSHRAFGTNGFGAVTLPQVNNSPSKSTLTMFIPTNVCACVVNTAVATAYQGSNLLVATYDDASVCFAPPPPCLVLGACTAPYPFTSTNPLTSIVFNESQVLRTSAVETVKGPGGCQLAHVVLFYNDEHALALGVKQVIVKTKVLGKVVSSTNNYPFQTLLASPQSITNPAVGSTNMTGDQAGVDVSGRPIFPALFVTDLGTNSNQYAGDWQYGGKAYPPTAVFGTWKGFVKTVDRTTATTVVTVAGDADPAKNDWNLGSDSDTPPSGLADEGYGAEVRWDTAELGLVPGHSYRLYFIVHDGDQNNVGGDCGQACATIALPLDSLHVNSVSSPATNGVYATGAVIPVTVTFNVQVEVTGTPQLALNSGAIVNYSSGTGTPTLTFNYTVGPTDNSPDLDESSSTALTLNGGTIQDIYGNAVGLALPAPGVAGSLGANKSIVIDTTPPATASVTSPADGSAYRGGTVPSGFSGSAADNSGGSGLNANSTTFTLQRATDNFYWTGSAWQPGVFNLATTHGAATGSDVAAWTSSVTLPAWPSQSDGVYTVQATATDSAGNTFIGTAISFTLDNTSPALASMTSPANGLVCSAASVPATFTGSAADNAGGLGLNTNSTTFTLQNPAGQYWSGSTWQAGVANLATVHGATVGNTAAGWSDNVTLPVWASQALGLYSVQATATDKVGNTFTGNPATFTLLGVMAPVSIGTFGTETGGTSNSTFTVSSGVSVGNSIIVTIALSTSSTATIGVTDSTGNTYTKNADVANGSAVRTFVFSAPVTTALTTNSTITLNVNGTSIAHRMISAFYVGGLVSVSPADKSQTATGISTSPSSGATALTAQPDEVLIGAFGCSNQSETFTAGSGYTALTAKVGSGVGSIALYPEYEVVHATNGYAANGALSASKTWAADIVTYKIVYPTASIARAGSSPTAANSVSFTVTFNEPVYNVAQSDFSLAASGVSGAAITGFSGSGTNYTVTVSTGAGSGTLGLNLTDDDSILDNNGIPLGGTGAGNGSVTGPAYSVRPTSVTVSSSANPAVYGSLVTFTSTVSVNVSGASTPSGTVTFYDGAASLGTGALGGSGTNATATYTTTATQLLAGAHSITAVYSGDALYSANTNSLALSQTMMLATVSISSGLTVNTKTYDGTTAATINSNNVVLSGVVSGDTNNVRLSTNGYAAVFASAGVGSNITVTVSGLTLTGSAATNYVLTQPTLTANITGKTVTASSGLTANSKVYDGTTTATISSNNVVLSGVLVGETNNVRLSTNGYAAVFASAGVGSNITVTVSGLTLTGSAATNYVLTQPTLAANITGKTVTVSSGLTANNKVYDGTTAATISSNNVVLSGVLAGDTNNVQLSTNGYAAGFASAGVGSNITVTVSGLTLTGSAATNYVLTQPTLAANITGKTVTVSSGLTANNKVYDGTTAATISSNNVVLSGVVAGDTNNVRLSTNGYAAVFASAGVGSNITVTVSGLTLTGSAATNYVLTQPTLAANITAPVIVSVTGPTNGYYRAGQNLNFTVVYNGAVTVNTGGGTPAISLTIGSNVRNAAYLSGSGSTNLTFRYAVQAGDSAASGISAASPIALNGGTINDGGGDAAGLTFTPPSTSGVLVDANPPVTASVTSVTNGSGFLAAGAPTKLSGSAADDSGGVGLNVNSSTLTLQRNSDSNYWNGAAWQATVTNLAATNPATTGGTVVNWTNTVALPTWASQSLGAYTVQATAADKAGNTFTGNPATFTLLAVMAPVSIGTFGTETGGTSNSTFTVSSGVSVGNSIIVTIALSTSSTATIGVTDSAGNTYTKNADVANGSAVRTFVFSAPVTTALTTNSTITINVNGASIAHRMVSAFYVGGLVSVSPADKSQTATGISTSPSSGATALTAQPDEVLIGAFGCSDQSETFTAGSGYTALTAKVGSGTGSIALYPEYEVVHATNGYAANGTISAKKTWAAAIVTYKVAYPTATITLAGAGPTAASNVNFTVTFSEPVYNVAPSAFSLATTGITGAAITGLSGSGTNYTVTVSTGAGSGTFGLNLADNDSIVDANGIPLGGAGAGNGSVTGPTCSIDRTTTAAISPSANPSTYGDQVTLTATVSANAAGAGTPGGTVIFRDGTTPLGTNTLNGSGTNATATYTTTATQLLAGAHSITVAYSGDATYSAGTNAPALLQTVSPKTVTPTITLNNKVYDGTTAATTIATRSLSSVIGADDVSLGASGTVAAFSSKNAGAYAVSVTGLSLSGTTAGNYVLSTTSVSPGASITAKTVTVTGLAAHNKTYDGTTAATFSGTAALQPAESPGSGTTSDGKPYTGDTVSVTGTPAGTFASANAGTNISVSVSGLSLSGAQQSDYSLTEPGLSAAIAQASSTNELASSATPARPGSNIVFTATISGVTTPAGTVQFKTGGAAIGLPVALDGSGLAAITNSSLPHGSNHLTAEYSGNVNFLTSTGSVLQIIDTSPTAGTNYLTTLMDMATNVSAASLAALDYDADGDPLSITAVAASSAQGGTVAFSSGTIRYTPPTNYVGADSFTYTISDSFPEGTNICTVNVTVNDTNTTIMFTSIILTNGVVNLRGHGIPNQQYDVQSSSDAMFSSYTTLATVTAAANGNFLYTNTNPPADRAFYRFVVH